jgi:hypothetical protein
VARPGRRSRGGSGRLTGCAEARVTLHPRDKPIKLSPLSSQFRDSVDTITYRDVHLVPSRGDFCPWVPSSSLIFSRSRSVTSRRNREFSSWTSAIRPPPRVRSGSVAPGGGVLRHRCNVMTLMPSARAISLCSLPRVAKSFACASFVAISALECRFICVIPDSSRPSVSPHSGQYM